MHYCVRCWASPFSRGGDASTFQTEILIRNACIVVRNHNWYFEWDCVLFWLSWRCLECVLWVFCAECRFRVPPRVPLCVLGPALEQQPRDERRTRAGMKMIWTAVFTDPARRSLSREYTAKIRIKLQYISLCLRGFARVAVREWVSRDARGR